MPYQRASPVVPEEYQAHAACALHLLAGVGACILTHAAHCRGHWLEGLFFFCGVQSRKDGLGTPPFLGFFYSYTLRRHPKTSNTNTAPSMRLLWGTLGPGLVMPNFGVFLEAPFWAGTPLETPLLGQKGGFLGGFLGRNPPFLDSFQGRYPPS